MIHNSVSYSIVGWCGIAGGIDTQRDWSLWAQNKLRLHPVLPIPQLETIPPRISRRLDNLGRCVMSACEQCLPLIETEPAIISVSRHGDLPAMDKLIQCAREREDISPTAFTYSVHNRFSSLISMIAGYHGVNGAYSSVRDGFPLVLAEATALIAENPALQVLVVAYEPEIPEVYHQVISTPWLPHIVAFVLQGTNGTEPKYSLAHYANPAPGAPGSGSCLPLIRTMLNKENYRDGFWEHQYVG